MTSDHDVAADAVRVGGIPVLRTTLAASVQRLLSARERDALCFRLLNTYSISLASRAPDYKALLVGPGENVPDGWPVVAAQRLLSRRAGGRRPQRVRGPSFFRLALDLGRARSVNHYLLGGGSPEVLAQLERAIASEFPGTRIVGRYCPAFAPLSEFPVEEWARMIVAADADVIWVGLGTPKQDHLAARLVACTGRSAAGVGAAFDFVAGAKGEAPRLVQRVGLEWMFRLLSEPRRLWRRYLLDGARFVRLVASDLRRKRRDEPSRPGR